MKRILSAAAAGALALSMLGAPVVAQEQTADAVMDQMQMLGMDTEGLVLTEEQVLQIEAILNQDADDSEKVSQINAVLGN